MRKFKLVKDYPNSYKKLGDIITFCDNCTEIVQPNDDGTEYYYTLDDCIKFEHWEEMVGNKKPLFTTEDGVEIFVGMDVYCVSETKKFIGQIEYVLNYDIVSIKDNISLGRKYFSTKEKAEKYLIMNNPCLSINDIISEKWWSQDSIQYLIDMVKERVKN